MQPMIPGFPAIYKAQHTKPSADTAIEQSAWLSVTRRNRCSGMFG